MKKITLLLAFMMLTVLGNAQQYQYARQLAGDGTTAFFVKVNDISHDTSTSRTYVVGTFQGSVDFQPGSADNIQTQATETGFLAIYNEGGELLRFNKLIAGFACKPLGIDIAFTNIVVIGQASTNTAKLVFFNKNTGAF